MEYGNFNILAKLAGVAGLFFFLEENEVPSVRRHGFNRQVLLHDLGEVDSVDH